MTSQKIMLNFGDLQNLSSEEIAEAISSQTAVEVTLKSIKNCEVSEHEIYKTWSTSLFKSYGPAGITETDLNTLLDTFATAIKELLHECGDCENDEQVERLYEFLTYSLELFTWIKTAASEFETNIITAFLCFGLSTIHNYLVALSKQSSRVCAAKIIKKSLELHTLILGVLTENPKTFVFDTIESSIGNLMSGLCSIGEIASQLDIKAEVETWKCITRLASHNVHLQSENNPTDGFIWLSKTMSFLIKQVGKNVQTVYTEASLNEPIQQIEKYLKVTNFYLRLLGKLAHDFRNVPFPICEELQSTLAVVFNAPVYIANNANISKVITDYVTKDLKELIPLAYRNKLFFKHLLSEHTANVHSAEVIHEIVLQTTEVIIRKNDPKFITQKLLNALFAYMSQSLTNGSAAKYNRFVEILSTLAIRFNDEPVRRKLILLILHGNTTEAMTAIDITCTIFMLSDQSTRISNMKFWIYMNERFVTYSNSMSALHMELLLKNLYTLLSPQEKDEICKSLNLQTLSHVRFTLLIGLEALPFGAMKIAIIKQLRNKLLDLLKERMTVENYYSIVNYLNLLKPINFQHDDLAEMLFQNLEIVIENKKLYLFAESILGFLASRIGYIDENIIQKILKMLNTDCDRLSTRLSFIEFLKSVSKLSKFENQSKEKLKILEGEEQTRTFGCLDEHNPNIAVDAEKCGQLWKQVIEKRSTSPTKQTHVCQVTPDITKNNHQADISGTLEALEKNTYMLQTLGEQLSKSDLETVKKIALKLKVISQLDR